MMTPAVHLEMDAWASGIDIFAGHAEECSDRGEMMSEASSKLSAMTSTVSKHTCPAAVSHCVTVALTLVGDTAAASEPLSRFKTVPSVATAATVASATDDDRPSYGREIAVTASVPAATAASVSRARTRTLSRRATAAGLAADDAAADRVLRRLNLDRLATRRTQRPDVVRPTQPSATPQAPCVPCLETPQQHQQLQLVHEFIYAQPQQQQRQQLVHQFTRSQQLRRKQLHASEAAVLVGLREGTFCAPQVCGDDHCATLAQSPDASLQRLHAAEAQSKAEAAHGVQKRLHESPPPSGSASSGGGLSSSVAEMAAPSGGAGTAPRQASRVIFVAAATAAAADSYSGSSDEEEKEGERGAGGPSTRQAAAAMPSPPASSPAIATGQQQHAPLPLLAWTDAEEAALVAGVGELRWDAAAIASRFLPGRPFWEVYSRVRNHCVAELRRDLGGGGGSAAAGADPLLSSLSFSDEEDSEDESEEDEDEEGGPGTSNGDPDGRGRVGAVALAAAATASASAAPVSRKRGRGRPRKGEVVIPKTPKRPRPLLAGAAAVLTAPLTREVVQRRTPLPSPLSADGAATAVKLEGALAAAAGPALPSV